MRDLMRTLENLSVFHTDLGINLNDHIGDLSEEAASKRDDITNKLLLLEQFAREENLLYDDIAKTKTAVQVIIDIVKDVQVIFDTEKLTDHEIDVLQKLGEGWQGWVLRMVRNGDIKSIKVNLTAMDLIFVSLRASVTAMYLEQDHEKPKTLAN